MHPGASFFWIWRHRFLVRATRKYFRVMTRYQGMEARVVVFFHGTFRNADSTE